MTSRFLEGIGWPGPSRATAFGREIGRFECLLWVESRTRDLEFFIMTSP